MKYFSLGILSYKVHVCIQGLLFPLNYIEMEILYPVITCCVIGGVSLLFIHLYHIH